MPAKLSVTMGDDYGRTTKRVYGMETQTLLADYLTVAGAFLTLLQAVTDLSMIKVDLIVAVTGETWAVTSGANVDVGATFSAWLDNVAPKKASHKIPSIKAALVGSDGSVALSGATIAYLDEFLTAGDFTLSDGETVDAWIKGALDK